MYNKFFRIKKKGFKFYLLKMACPECGSVFLTLVANKIDYKFEPNFETSFLNNKSFYHEHDFNQRISIWRCSNNHEFEISRLKPCIACTEQKQYESFLERIKVPSSSSDGYPLIFSNSFQPPPAIM